MMGADLEESVKTGRMHELDGGRAFYYEVQPVRKIT